MNLSQALTSPSFMVLFKWTTLLMLGWLTHWLLRNRHARLRLVLWQSILCIGLALPWLQFVQIPGQKIPITYQDSSSPEFAVTASPVSTGLPSQPVADTSKPSHLARPTIQP